MKIDINNQDTEYHFEHFNVGDTMQNKSDMYYLKTMPLHIGEGKSPLNCVNLNTNRIVPVLSHELFRHAPAKLVSDNPA
jgi:hypothetical protein